MVQQKQMRMCCTVIEMVGMMIVDDKRSCSQLACGNRLIHHHLRPDTPGGVIQFREQDVQVGRVGSSRSRDRRCGSRVGGEKISGVGTGGQVGDGEGVDTLVAVVVVHGLEAVDVKFAEVVLGDHGQADALVAVRLLLGGSLGLLLGNLQLRGIEVHELGLDVFLGRLRLNGSSLLLGLRLLLSRLLRGRCGLGDLLLELTKTKR